MEYKLFRVYIPPTQVCIDSWAKDIEEAYSRAGFPSICEIKEMKEKGGWRTICILNLTESKEALK